MGQPVRDTFRGVCRGPTPLDRLDKVLRIQDIQKGRELPRERESFTVFFDPGRTYRERTRIEQIGGPNHRLNFFVGKRQAEYNVLYLLTYSACTFDGHCVN